MNLIALPSLDVTATGAGNARKVRILAYSGNMMSLSGGPVVIDLAGMELLAGGVPLLVDHDSSINGIVGSGSASKGKDGLTVTGSITATNDAAKAITGHLDSDTPLQASVGAQILDSKYIEAGAKFSANGKQFTAPRYGVQFITKSVLREVSLLPLGADGGTSVVKAALRRGSVSVDGFDTWLTECGMDPNAVPPAQRTKLEAAYLAKYPAKAPAASVDALERILGNHPALLADAIEAGWTETQARTEAVTALRASRPTATGGHRGKSHSIGGDHIAAALMTRSGHHDTAVKAFGADVMEQSRHLQGASFIDLCTAGLKADGRDVVGLTKPEIIKAALSGGSLTVALGSSADKILAATYMSTPATWRSFAAIKSASNFREQTSLRPTFAGDLEQLPEGGSIQHGSITEETYEWQLKTYAKQYQIGRQSIINDDLNVFAELLPGFGKAAMRSVNDLVYTTLLANAGSFFSSGNANLSTGGGSALSTSALATAVKKMRIQKDSDNNDLDIQPSVLLVGPTNEVTARGLLQSAEIARSTASDLSLPTGNTFQNLAKLEIESRLENTTFTGYSTTAWYLFASPADSPVNVCFLDSQQTPIVESFGFDHDVNKLSAAFRVYFDYGCALGDYRAAQKNDGA